MSFKNGLDDSHDQPVSQKSDTTGATIGSLQSLPSSISSPPGGRDMILSPSSTSSGSRQSVRSEVSARLAGKRMSIETVSRIIVILRSRVPDRKRIFISVLLICSQSPMFDHLLESSHRDDSNKWSNMGFGEEITQVESIEVNFIHII